MVRLYVFLMAAVSYSLAAEERMHKTHDKDEYLEGTRAELVCAFPPGVKGILQWATNAKLLPSKLRCRTVKTCDEYEGYNLTRNQNNITLVIERVNPLMYKWQCEDLLGNYGDSFELNIKRNPSLSLKIELSETDSLYKITTGCSTLPMNVTCVFDDKPLPLKFPRNTSCENPVLSQQIAFVSIIKEGNLTCTVTRNEESFSTSYIKSSATYRAVGGSLVGIGVILVAIAVIIHFTNIKPIKYMKYVGLAGISLFLIGVAVLSYNHVIEVFVAFMVFGVGVALGSIIYLIYEMSATTTVGL